MVRSIKAYLDVQEDAHIFNPDFEASGGEDFQKGAGLSSGSSSSAFGGSTKSAESDHPAGMTMGTLGAAGMMITGSAG